MLLKGSHLQRRMKGRHSAFQQNNRLSIDKVGHFTRGLEVWLIAALESSVCITGENAVAGVC